MFFWFKTALESGSKVWLTLPKIPDPSRFMVFIVEKSKNPRSWENSGNPLGHIWILRVLLIFVVFCTSRWIQDPPSMVPGKFLPISAALPASRCVAWDKNGECVSWVSAEMGVFKNRNTGIPQNGWLIVENPIKIDANKGYVPLFSETSKWWYSNCNVYARIQFGFTHLSI